MFLWEAPFPRIQTTSVMPNPSFGDGEARASTVTVKRALDGTLRTYVTSPARQRLTWQFRLTRAKALELREFYRSYHASAVRVSDHNGRVWIGHILSNPLDVENAASGRPPVQNVRGELSTLQIEFEGVQQ